MAEASALHCKEMSTYIFPERELRDLSSNFLIHVSVSDLYISTIDHLFLLQQTRQTDRGNTVYKLRTET